MLCFVMDATNNNEYVIVCVQFEAIKKRELMHYFLCILFKIAILTLAANATDPHPTNEWYPSNPKKLIKAITNMSLDAQKIYADPFINSSSVRAMIVPHAGIQYSGTVACAAYLKLDPSTKRIIILAPDHHGLVSTIALPSTNNYAVPNGIITIDTSVIKGIVKQGIGTYADSVFKSEHSYKVQLPFIKYYCPNASIVPLIIGNISCNQAQKIAAALKKYINKNTVVIVSSDFVHYGQGYNFTPFIDHQQLRARDLNSQAVQCIEGKNCTTFNDFLHTTHATICGAHSILILLKLLEMQLFGPIEPRLIAYDTSSKSDTDDFVSYIGMIFTTQERPNLPFDALLTNQEKQGLITQASDTLTHMFEQSFDATLYYPLISYGVKQSTGAFATLYGPQKALRGCIGHITTHEPLYKTVAAVTQDAAQSDSRFKPLTKHELQTTTVHLSILSKPQQIKNLKEITLGKNGVIFEHNSYSALFLPEVATEQGWSKEDLLNNLAQKAGLQTDAWKKKDSHFKIFSTITIP